MTAPRIATFAEFATLAGFKRSYITQLKGAGRLVLDDAGKRVLVDESFARIASTADPSKAAVAARHASKRDADAPKPTADARKRPADASKRDSDASKRDSDASKRDSDASKRDSDAPTTPDPAADATGDATDGDGGPDGTGFSYWRSRNEKAKALASERENAVADGKLLDASAVTASVSSAITTLRTRLEALPDVLGPQLAAVVDETAARNVLAEAIEHALDEMARQFSLLAKQVTT